MSFDNTSGDENKIPLSFNGLLDKFANKGVESLGNPPVIVDKTLTSTPPDPSNDQDTRNDRSHSKYFIAPNTPTKKRKKPARRYASPSKYSHLSPVADSIAPNLICIFVGLNPGVTTAQKGHAFANPTNLFWPLLFESGCVGRKLTYKDDRDLPRDWSLGITNLVSRPTAEQSELAREEMVRSSEELENKIRQNAPKIVCIIGKGIWEAIYRFKMGKPIDQSRFSWGWQDNADFLFAASSRENEESSQSYPRVFVVPSTSGRVAAYSRAMKADLWRILGETIQGLRELQQSVKKEAGWPPES